MKSYSKWMMVVLFLLIAPVLVMGEGGGESSDNDPDTDWQKHVDIINEAQDNINRLKNDLKNTQDKDKRENIKQDIQKNKDAQKAAMKDLVTCIARMAADVTGDPVLVTSGAYLFEETDIAIPGSSFAVKRRYVSGGLTTGGSLGGGWAYSLDERIIRGAASIEKPKGSRPDIPTGAQSAINSLASLANTQSERPEWGAELSEIPIR